MDRRPSTVLPLLPHGWRPDAITMTVYLYMHPLDQAGERQTLMRLNALRALRDELSAYAGVRVIATPQAADLEVEIVNVVATDEPAAVLSRDAAQRILVVRMARGGERLDFVCSDGRGELTAERQAARRIRNWVAGEDFLTLTRAVDVATPLRAIA